MNFLLFPLSRYKALTPVLILLSAIVVVGQSILTDASSYVLWGNWISAGFLSVCIWYMMGRFHLGGVSEGKALAITWPLMSMTQNFAYLYFSPSDSPLQGQLQLFALICIIFLVLSTWQEEQATLRHLCIGLIVGFTSTLFPHSILWLLMVPFVTFHMRSWSTRNVCSIFTGAVLGVWIIYFLLTLLQSPADADAMILHYADIIDTSDYFESLQKFDLWQWLYLATLVLMVIIYSISAMLLGTGHSMRASASILLISTLSIAEVVFLCLDFSHTALFINQLALYLCIQLTEHQANLRSSANEWWTILILLIVTTISILPLVYKFL